MGCEREAVAVSPFFSDPTGAVGIKFEFCKSHTEYYRYYLNILDYCIWSTQNTGKWPNFQFPRFADYEKAIADAEAKQQGGQGQLPK